MKNYTCLSILFLFLISSQIYAQTYNTFAPELNIPVKINGNFIKNPWVGGFNTPIFSTIDLNGDGIKDLFVFEKNGGYSANRYTTYLNDGIPGQVSYTYAPEYEKLFPPNLHDWVLLYDFDCDGKEDIFTYTYMAGMEVWHNDYSVANGLSFSFHTNLIYSQYGQNNVNLYVSAVNLPALADVDNDGDMDVLTFAITGNNVEYHMNYSLDSLGMCGLKFFLADDAWGHFLLSSASNIAVLGVAKPMASNDSPVAKKKITDSTVPFASRHSGSCMIAVDFDGNNVKELINGDVLGNNLLYLENTGTKDSAYVTSQDTIWPHYDTPVNFITFPAAYNIDVDNDGKKDIIVSSCTGSGAAENFNNVLFYKNTGSASNASFTYQKNTLFQDEMIEVGEGANVALLDVDNDGLKDMIIGNYGYFAQSLPLSELSYYRNTGTLTSPAFELITRDYMNTSTLGITGLYPCFGDIDGDGDDDMVLGCTDGTLQLYLNTAGPGHPPNFVMPVNGPNFLGIDVGLFSAPQLVDIDRDGKLDLLIGERQGNLNYYRNTSVGPVLNFTLVSSTFGDVDVVKHNISITGYSTPVLVDINNNYELFVGSESGYIYHYVNIDNNLNGTFALIDTTYKDICEKSRITFAFADMNNDGLSDMLTGNNAGGVRFYFQHVSAVGVPALTTACDYSIFPNPATDQLLIKFHKTGNHKVEIYGMAGNLLFNGYENGNQKRIDISSLANGMYILKVKDDSKTTNKKFIVSRQ